MSEIAEKLLASLPIGNGGDIKGVMVSNGSAGKAIAPPTIKA